MGMPSGGRLTKSHAILAAIRCSRIRAPVAAALRSKDAMICAPGLAGKLQILRPRRPRAVIGAKVLAKASILRGLKHNRASP